MASTELPFNGPNPTSYEEARRADFNVIRSTRYRSSVQRSTEQLSEQRGAIESIVRHHLRLAADDTCIALARDRWFHVNIDICILVQVVRQEATKTFVLRCPLQYEGVAVDERTNRDVATHIWIQEMCHDVPVADIIGFGFSDGRHYTHASHRPFHKRLIQNFWRFIHRVTKKPMLSQFSVNPTQHALTLPYILSEHLESEDVEILEKTWNQYRGEPDHAITLYRQLSRIMFNLARIPQARIGTFKFHENGTVDLTNRYLPAGISTAENEGAPRNINGTYRCTYKLASDLISFHDQRFEDDPSNAIGGIHCCAQMAVLVLLRTVSQRYIAPVHAHGPFLLQHTNLNPSNILVDKEWKVKGLLDIGSICAQPAQMLYVPPWLSGQPLDRLVGDRQDEFNEIRKIFMARLEEVEESIKAEHDIRISEVMERTWHSNGVWFWLSLLFPKHTDFLARKHLTFAGDLSGDAEDYLSDLWVERPRDFVKKKVEENGTYDNELRQLYRANHIVEEVPHLNGGSPGNAGQTNGYHQDDDYWDENGELYDEEEYEEYISEGDQ